LQKLLQQLQADGITCVTLHVSKSNSTAIRFYMKEGFYIAQHLPQFYYYDDAKHDALLMCWNASDPSSKWKGEQIISNDGQPEGSVAVLASIALIGVILLVVANSYLYTTANEK